MPRPRSTNLDKARSIVRGNLGQGAAEFSRAVQSVREFLSRAELVEFVEWLFKSSGDRRRVVLASPIADYSRLRESRPLPPVSLDKEIVFCAAGLEPYLGDLSQFVIKGVEFSGLLFEGRFEKAQQKLDDVRVDHGVSEWLLEAQFALWYASNNQSEIETFVSDLKERMPNRYPAFLAHYLAQRYDKDLMSWRFLRTFYRNVDREKFGRDVSAHLVYRVGCGAPSDNIGWSYVLRSVASGSPCDMYETLMDLFVSKLDDSDPQIVDGIGRSLRLLRVSDARLERVRREFTAIHPSWQFDGSSMADGAKQFGDLGELLHAERFRELAIDSVGTGTVPEFPPSPLLEVLTTIVGVFTRGTERRDESDLLRLCLVFRATALANVLFEFWVLWRGSPTELWAASQTRRLLNAIAESEKAPEQVRSRPNDYQAVLDGILGMWHMGEYEKCLEALREFPQDAPSFFRQQVQSLQIALLKDNNQLSEAASIVVGLGLDKSEEIARIPLSYLVHGRSWADFRELHGAITLVLLLYLHVDRHNDDLQEFNLRYACASLVKAKQVKRPSELLDRGTTAAETRAIAFGLHKAFVRENLEHLPGMNSTFQLERERLAICQVLAAHVPEYAEECSQEILDIEQRLLMLEGGKQLDKSRVYVNTAGLTRWAKDELSDVFDQYLAKREDSDISIDDLESLVQGFIKEGTPLPEYVFRTPSAGSSSVFVDLVQQLQSAYLNHREYGLNCYLSLRIRHGTLAGYLRGAVEKHSLVTKLAGAGEQYKHNEVWTDQFDEEPIRRQADRAFSNFSKGMDRAIAELRDEYMQIRSPDKPRGVFNLPLQPAALHVLLAATNSVGAFEEFIHVVFEYFRQLLIAQLRTVKRTLLTENRRNFEDLFERLRSELTANHVVIFDELDRAIAAGSRDLTAELNRIALWFDDVQVSDALSGFTFGQAIDIAISAAKGILQHVAVVVRIADNVGSEPCASLGAVNDVIFIALENASKYSQRGGEAQVQLDVTAGEPGRVRFSFSSPLDPEENRNSLEEKLRRIRVAISGQNYHQLANTEGGTGILKLRRHVGDTPDLEKSLFFGPDGDAFVLRVEIAR